MNIRYQRGVSTWTLMAWLYLIISLAFVSTKLAPVYIDDLTIKKAIESISREGNLANLSAEQVRNRLLQIFQINGIRDFDGKLLKIKKQEKVYLLDIEYEKRVPFYKNVDAIMAFKHHYELGAQ